MDRTGIIAYRGQDIVYVDYSCVDSIEDLRGRIRKTEEVILAQKRGGLLELVDVRDSEPTPQMLILIQEIARKMAPFIRKSAIVGVGGLTRVLLDFVNQSSGRAIEPKSTIDEAKDWLVADGR